MFGYLKFFIFLFILFAMPLDGFAEDDDVKSLGEILNQGPVQDDDGVELTPKLLANRYYKECTKEKSLIFDEEEQNLLCTCVSANMARTLSVEEFQLLDEDSAQGKTSRGTMLAYAYAPCMKPLLEIKVKKDCAVSDEIKDIVVGKRKVCGCTVDFFKGYIDTIGPQIITEAVYHNKMETNPLRYYFINWPYKLQLQQYLKQCLFAFRYEKQN